MMVALLLSVVFALAVGIWAARSRRAEAIILPTLDILQSIPILGFFPIVIAGIYGASPNGLGANLAVIFLIFTSMSWNIAFGVYEAVKEIPHDYADLLSVSQTTPWQRIKSLYIPASMSKVAYNAQSSWAVGLFFLVASEVITVGCPNAACYGLVASNHTFTVPVGFGIGKAVIAFYPGDIPNYLALIGGIIVAVIVWQYVFLREFALWSEKYKMMEEPREAHNDPVMRFYSWVNQRSISKLFLLTQGKGVTRFTSVLTKFRRSVKYAVLIIAFAFLLLIFENLSAMGSVTLGGLPTASQFVASETTVLYALGASFVRVWYVYAVCVAIGLPLGIVISLNFRLYDLVAPVLEVVSSVPAPILLPLIVLVPVIGGAPEAVAAIVIMLSIIWYIIFNVMAGVRSLPADIKGLPQAFRVGTLSAWRNVYVPGALSGLVTGSIAAIGGAWNALIVAEYFTFSSGEPLTQVGTGIGKLIVLANNRGDILTMTLAVVTMTVLIVAFNLLVWRRVYHHVTERYAYNR